MKHLLIFSLAFSLAITIGCKSTSTSPTGITDNNIPPDFQVILEQQAGFCECPSYSVEVNANGDVTFTGKSFTKVMGTATAHAANAVLVELVDACRSNGFFSLDSSYMSGPSDCSSAVTTITFNDTNKRVFDYHCANVPQGLRDYEKLVDSLLQTAQWVR